MTHSEMQELLPLYALDALPDDEDFELRMHVEMCQECAETLRDHLETAGALATTVERVAPPAALRQRILEQATFPVQVDSAPRQRVPLLRRWLPAAAVAAFVAVASLSAVLARRIDTQNAEIREQRRLLALVSSPGVEAVPLKATSIAAGASGRVFIDRAQDVSAMVVSGLRDPGDRVYALWLIESGKPKLIENFSPDPSGAAVSVLRTEVGEDRPVAVTLEPRPGTSAPQGPAVLSL